MHGAPRFREVVRYPRRPVVETRVVIRKRRYPRIRPWLPGPDNTHAHVPASRSPFRAASYVRRVTYAACGDGILTTDLKERERERERERRKKKERLGSFRLPSLSRFVRSLIFGWPPVGYDVSRPPTRVFELSGLPLATFGLPRIAPARCDAMRYDVMRCVAAVAANQTRLTKAHRTLYSVDYGVLLQRRRSFV